MDRKNDKKAKLEELCVKLLKKKKNFSKKKQKK